MTNANDAADKMTFTFPSSADAWSFMRAVDAVEAQTRDGNLLAGFPELSLGGPVPITVLVRTTGAANVARGLASTFGGELA